jgi:hypothetical protein
MSRLKSGGMLVEADDVSSWIAEACSDLGSVGADGLDDFAAMAATAAAILAGRKVNAILGRMASGAKKSEMEIRNWKAGSGWASPALQTGRRDRSPVGGAAPRSKTIAAVRC